MSNRQPLVQVHNVTVQFEDRLVLDNISLEVFAGEILCILGESGCGKSTLLRVMTGLLPPTSGEVWIMGQNLWAVPEQQQRQILRHLGVLFQSSGLLRSLTIAENIALPLQMYTHLTDLEIMEIVRLKLAAVGLSGSEALLPAELSGGMQKRAGIARALALDPPLLFLDEPTSGLDPVTAASIDQLVLEFKQIFGTTMVVVTHDLESTFTIADRVLLLDRHTHTIIAEGDPRTLRNRTDHPAVYSFFNRLAKLER